MRWLPGDRVIFNELTSPHCPIMVLNNSMDIKVRECIDFSANRRTAIMSSQTLDTITNKLRRACKAVLLKIARDLEIDQREGLRFYYGEIVMKEDTGALNILRSLEFSGKISWQDLSFLKEGLRVVERLDLVKILTEFEIKRDLTVFLDMYARKRQGLELSCRSTSVEQAAECLVKIMTEGLARESNIGSLMEPRKSIKKVLGDFEEEIEHAEHERLNSWNKLTLLVVIAGEIVAEALANEEHRQKTEVMELCLSAADELCYRMLQLKQGSWVS